jgi:hypothetical protein
MADQMVKDATSKVAQLVDFPKRFERSPEGVSEIVELNALQAPPCSLPASKALPRSLPGSRSKRFSHAMRYYLLRRLDKGRSDLKSIPKRAANLLSSNHTATSAALA